MKICPEFSGRCSVLHLVSIFWEIIKEFLYLKFPIWRSVFISFIEGFLFWKDYGKFWQSASPNSKNSLCIYWMNEKKNKRQKPTGKHSCFLINLFCSDFQSLFLHAYSLATDLGTWLRNEIFSMTTLITKTVRLFTFQVIDPWRATQNWNLFKLDFLTRCFLHLINFHALSELKQVYFFWYFFFFGGKRAWTVPGLAIIYPSENLTQPPRFWDCIFYFIWKTFLLPLF